MKKKALSLILTACMAFGLCACGGSSSSQSAASDQPAEAAEASTENAEAGAENTEADAAEAGAEAASANTDVSGKVVIYTSMYEDIIEDMEKDLKDVFPNLEIEFFQGGSGTLQSKIAAEMDSGKMGCDILMLAEPSYALELKEKGMLHPYKYAETDKLLFDYDEEGYWYPVRVLNMVLGYNPDLYNKEELPKTFKEFAEDTSVKDMISMSNPLTSGSAYSSVVALYDLYGEDYFKALGQQNVAIESGSVALTKLETGECKQIMILEESILKKREEEGSALEAIYPEDGTIAIPSPIMIVDEKVSANANIAACEAVEDYFLSPAGQQLIIKGWMYGVRSDVKDYPYDGSPVTDLIPKFIPVDWEKCYKERDAIRGMFQNHVTVPAE
ncbi:MAG: ABC transporter substrate-binding protein [Lachnospiraceae bacterium]|nr:ABC transporter substrate-binding protein [Lachnospiraceae bacterium]